MHRLTGRAWKFVLLLSILSLLAAACGGGADGAAEQEPEVETTQAEDTEAEQTEAATEDEAVSGEVQSSITLGVNNPNYATQLPIFIAKDKGYLEEVGITDIEVITTDDYVPGLIGGSLDITQGDTNVLVASAQESGEPITFLGTYRDKEWQIMGVGPEIETAQDLVGTQVTAGQRGSRAEFIMRTILEEVGLDPDDDVEFVPMGGGSDARLQALLTGQVAGANVFPRHRAALEEAGGHFIHDELVDVPQEGLAVMGGDLEENRATVVAYLTATLRARQYMADLDNQDEILGIMRDNGFEIPEEFVAQYQVEIEQISVDGGFEPGQMDEMFELLEQLELVPADLEWRPYIDMEPLWEAQEALDMPLSPDPADL